ncbi:MAG: hypothetical protein EOP84_18865, partial [Verrucomicrobiaceae bacterium]
FQQALLRANYRPSALLAIDGTVGLELRESGDSSEFNPIFGLGITWRPRLGTAVALAAESRIFNSASVENTNYRSTSVSLRVSQRIGYRLTASAALGYEIAEYESLGGGRSGSRRDELLGGSLELSLPITQRWSWALTLSASENISNERPFELYQVVLQTTYSF